jgi:hypothetical protein
MTGENTPRYKLKEKKIRYFRHFLDKYCKRNIPQEPSLRKLYLPVSSQSLKKIEKIDREHVANFMRGLRTDHSTVARFGNESLCFL